MMYGLKNVKEVLSIGLVALFCSFKLPDGNSEWQLLKEVDGIRFYARIIQCQEGQSPHFSIKLENPTTADAKVDFTLLLPEVPVLGPVNRTVENLEAGEILSGDCSVNREILMMQLISPADDIADVEISATVTKN